MPINKTQLDSFRKRIAKDRLEEVIEELVASINGSSLKSVRSWRNQIIGLKADLVNLEQANNSGERTPSEYNAEHGRLRRRVLELLDDLEQGKSYRAPVSGSDEGRNRNLFGYASLGLVAVAAIAWFAWPDNSDATIDHEEVQLCPVFDADREFKIMVLPYESFKGEPNRALHRTVSGRMQTFAQDYRINATAEAVGLEVEKISNYPSGPDDADALGENCGSQLVVWGYTEEENGLDQTTTVYRFVESEEWMFSEYQLDESMQVDTARTITELVRSGQLTSGIEEAMRLIFGLMARELGDDMAAIAALSDHPANPADSAAYKLQQLVLADAYHNQGQDDQAVEAYSDLIEVDPENLLAWRNRGTLRYNLEDYEASASDLSVVLDIAPGDDQARYTRALANLQLDQIEQAQYDFYYLTDRPEITTPDGGTQNPDESSNERNTRSINQGQVQTLQQHIELRQIDANRRVDLGNAALNGNRSNIADMKSGMQAAYALGRYQEAAQLSEGVLAAEPENEEANKVAAQSYSLLGDANAAQRIVAEASRKGLLQNFQLRQPQVLRADTVIMARPIIQNQRLRRQ